MGEGRGVLEVVAALLVQDGRLLVCQRRADAPFALKWEFPGGKVQPGEEYQAALRRELEEELGIDVRSSTEVFHHVHLYPDQTEVDLTFYRVDHYEGEVTNRVFQKILWIETGRLRELDFLEGDLPFIERFIRGEL